MSPINDVTAVKGGCQEFCDDSNKALWMKSGNDGGRGGPKLSKIAWRYIWTTPYVTFCKKMFAKNTFICKWFHFAVVKINGRNFLKQ